MFSLTSAKLTGSPGESGWAQVHEFLPEDVEKLSKRGRLFAVIATKKLEEGVERITVGRELLARLHEEYFGDLEKTPYEALKGATEKVAREFDQSVGEIEIAAVSLVDNVVYSTASGGAKVCVFKQGILATILESTGPSSISASGYPKEGDILILGTSLFFETAAPGVLRAALESKDAQSAVESLAPTVHGKENIGSLGAVIVSFNQGTKLSEAVVSEPKTNLPTTSSIKDRLTKLFSKATKLIPERKIYLKGKVEPEEINQGRKTTLSIGAILLILLMVSIGFGIRQKINKDYKASYEIQLTHAESDYQEALGLSSVSADKARELFLKSRDGVDAIISKGVKDSRVDELKKKIDQSQGEILGEYLADTEMFLDLSLLSSGFNGDEIQTSGGSLYILDKAGKKIVSVGLETKKSQVVAGPDKVEDPTYLASYEDRVFILSSSGIYELQDEKKKVLEKDWQGEALIAAYAGNIYILDKSEEAIFRYAGTESGFSSKQNWLGAGVTPDFSDVTSWAIDGSVYVLFPSSNILKYSLGSPKNFSVQGEYPKITKIDALFADQEDEFVYLLDRSGKRVVVVDKDGAYKAQYINEKVADATGLAVSEADKKIILLVANKLYAIELK
ncbi:hypothetical protein ACFL1Q_00945 [Patescibacteria group bacterium]